MQRRTLLLIVVLLLALGTLAGCGGGQEEPTEAPAPTEAAAVDEAVAEEEAAEPAEEAPAEEAPAEEAAAEEPAAEEPAAEEAAEEAATEEPAEEAAEEAATEEPAEEAAEEAATEEPVEEAAEEAATEEPAEEAAEEAATEEPVEEAAEEAATEEPAEEAAEEAAEGDAMAASAGTVTVESARSIPDVLNEQEAVFTAISPDGSMLAYAKTEGRFWNHTGFLCIFTFENANVACYEVNAEMYYGYMPALVWSPDSTRVAFTENPIQLGYESDIWTLNAADGTITNLTDDGVVGSWMTAEAGTFTLDYLPMWDESTGDLYFWRSVPTGELAISFELMKLAGGEGEAELVHDLSADLQGMIMTWDIEDYFMDGPSALSPDGTQIAMVMQAFENTNEDPRTGVWLLDVASGELTQVATWADYSAAIPAWQEVPPWGRAVQWTGDSAGFVLLVNAWSSQFPMNVFYYIDAASGEMTPVVDFSGVESYEALMTAPEDGIPMRYYSPWTATVSPAGDKLFMLSDLAGVAGLLTSQLPATDELPAVAGAAESYSSMGGTRSSTAENGMVVIYGFLLTTVEE